MQGGYTYMKTACFAHFVFRPGDIVPFSGQYWIRHRQHRLAHLASIRLQAFPFCACCGDSVRFTVSERNFSNAPLISDDKDFMNTSNPFDVSRPRSQ